MGVQAAVGWPRPALGSFVERYLGYRQEGLAGGSHQGLPSRHVTVIISLGPPVDIAAMPDPAQPPGSFPAFAAGLHAAPATVHHDGNQYGVHLELTPPGARALLGVPAWELASRVVDLGDLLGRRASEMADRLATTPGWPERFAVLDAVLARGAVEVDPPAPEVAWAWRRLVTTGGAVQMSALAAAVGWSRRHLSERFRRELGLPPKVVARVLRFERSRRVLERPGRPGLAEVAVACGYYDQAHLTRDWRELAGCTPTAWMAAELPSVQDTPVQAGAS
ncbi:MAG: helix-turn-helix domain-containing protein [Actinomycetota bacterium]|nr:helix-turn-helix domain-containing protein [Actinomycetota bacterium]MDQ3640042.1 helix-turn-helix domain-containing protein [Actinomycetota bacterium]